VPDGPTLSRARSPLRATLLRWRQLPGELGRGLWDSTLLIWHGEFGRLPISQRLDGRDHNPYGFTIWLGGGGIKGGTTVGATDEFGLRATESKKSINDLHATILHLFGLDHTKLTYYYNGRNMRLTDVSGEVIREVLA
jgi:hypothetical protein